MSELEIVKRLKKLMERAEQLNRIELVVGIPNDKNSRDESSGITNSELGIIHEFGATINHPGGTGYSKNSNGKAKFVSNSFVGPVHGRTGAHVIVIPERSFMRSTASEEAENLGRLTNIQISQYLKGEISAHNAYATVGAYLRGKILYKIGSSDLVPNTSETIRRKKSSKPLIDEGGLQGSITYEIREK